MGNKPGKMENLVTMSGLPAIYRNKKVFITGHTGFKGSWLSAILSSIGVHVKGYALPPDEDQKLYSLLWKNIEGESIFGDIRDKEKLKTAILDFAPDFIFHLAAQPLVRRSYEIPAETFEVNAIGTANLLESLTSLKNKCTVIIVTTDKVYQNQEKEILYKEEDLLGGHDPYSASKACTELVTASFRNSFFNPSDISKHQKKIVSARAGNVIGGGDWSKDRLIPDIVRSLTSGKVVEVRNPDSVRPWQHVLEPLTGYLLLAANVSEQSHAFSDAYNFGPLPEDHLTVKELVELVLSNWGKGQWKEVSDERQPHEAKLLLLDIGLASKELGWKPKLNSKTSVEWTINWYRQPVEKAADYTFKQIQEYFSL
jgi:CDP-glucose 4,6-dehydratase